LSNYRQISSFNDLVKIFPFAVKYDRKEETDMDFVLAMVALEESPFPFTQLFGLDLLFEIISDPVRSANIKRLYDFDDKSFKALTAQHDVFSREEVAALWGTVAERDGQIAALYHSTSWRITWSYRIVGHQLKRFRRVVELTKPAIQLGGGLKNTFKQAIHIYRREGLAGIKRGLRIVATSSQTNPILNSGKYDRKD
jgi:hypothetical protein